MNKKPKKKKSKYEILKDNIKKHTDKIDINGYGLYSVQNININTDLEIVKKVFTEPIINCDLKLKNQKLINDPIKTRIYSLLPNKKQEITLQKWFDAYIELYNCVIHKIKEAFRKELLINKKFNLADLKIDLDNNTLHKEFYKEKEQLKEKYSINMHILDYAIMDAVTMYKSKISNLNNGHIKKSRLRYLKKSKDNKIIKIENQICQSDTFCSSELGKKMITYPQINFKDTIKIVGIVKYDFKKNKYYLYVREHLIDFDNKKYQNQLTYYNSINETTNDFLKIKDLNNNKSNKDIINEDNKSINIIKKLNKSIDEQKRSTKKEFIYKNKNEFKNKESTNKNIISLDPGIRVFLTGISNDHIIDIGKNISVEIKKKLKFMDRLNTFLMSSEKRQQLIERTWCKLKNKVKDYHWKVIDYLTSNYKHILIGNFSTKSMGKSNIPKIVKRIGQNLSLYLFKQRLQYKCFLKGVKYLEVDEYCTSKCCSNCGSYKKDLEANKIYDCLICGNTYGRDINAAKSILMNGII